MVTLLAADLPRGGTWRVCYCTDYDGCDDDTDYTVEAKILTVVGAGGLDIYPCVRYAPECTITVTGTGLSTADSVQAIPSGESCGVASAVANFTASRNLSIGGTAVSQAGLIKPK
jgi:hypothetical protein